MTAPNTELADPYPFQGSHFNKQAFFSVKVRQQIGRDIGEIGSGAEYAIGKCLSLEDPAYTLVT